MIKKISLLFGLVAALPASALAWIGGPFDNGDYSAAFDDSGIYQASIRFKNGSGFAQWGSNVSLRPQAAAAGAAAATQSNGSILNRSVIYANGITYVGMATGMVDTVENVIIGQTNGASDGIQASAQGTSATGAAAGQLVSASGGRRFSANSYFRAKITQKHPVLKFSGTGQISLLGPDSSQVIGEIAQQIVENSNANLTPQEVPIANTVIFREIRTIAGTGGAAPTVVETQITYARDPREIIADQEVLIDFASRNVDRIVGSQINTLESVRDYLANSPAAAQDMVTEKITVFGTRKFFLSTR